MLSSGALWSASSQFGSITLSSPDTSHPFRSRGLRAGEILGAWSYAIYLLHKAIFYILKSPLKQAGINLESPLALSLMMLCFLLGGYLLYLLVETLFMRLRDRHFGHAANQPPVKLPAPKGLNLS